MIEIEELMSIVLLLVLNSQVSAVGYGQYSLSLHSVDEVEWSVSVETGFWVKSCFRFSFLLIKINNLPSLVWMIFIWFLNNLTRFSVSSIDIKNCILLNVLNIQTI